MSVTTYPGLAPHHSHHVDSLYNNVKGSVNLLSDGKLESGEIVQLGSRLVLLSENIHGLAGVEKQALVLAVIKRIIDDLPLDDNDRLIANTILTTVLPPAIEFAIRASRGEFNLNEKWRTVKTFFRENCNCCCRGTAVAPDAKLVAQPLRTKTVDVEPSTMADNRAARSGEESASGAPPRPPAQPPAQPPTSTPAGSADSVSDVDDETPAAPVTKKKPRKKRSAGTNSE